MLVLSLSGMGDRWGGGRRLLPQNASDIYLIRGQSCEGLFWGAFVRTDYVT